METLLRKKDLVQGVGVAKSTIADWVTEFNVYIPKIKQGAVVYYRPETIDVLNAIKEMRERDYSKIQIMELLAKRGFPITVEEAVEDIERVLAGVDPRDTLLTVMQTMGQAMKEIAEQQDRLDFHDTRLEAQADRMDGQDGRMAEMERTVAELQRQLAESRVEISAAKELANRSVWSRLFGRK